MKLTQRELQQYSLARLASGERGLEQEISAQISHDAGQEHDARLVTVPWQVFGRHHTRDMTTVTAGNLIAETTGDPITYLMPWSVVARAGVSTVSGLVGDVRYPKESTSPTGYWLSGETGIITESQPTIASVNLSPKRAGARVEYTHMMSKQANIEQFLSRALLAEMGRLVDVAVLAGSGVSGEPAGILGATGVGSIAGASFDFADAHAMLSGLGNIDDERITFIGPAAVRSLLGQRDIGTNTGRFIWDTDGIVGKRAVVSASAPAATLVAGDFQHVLLATWGQGPQVLVDPYTQGFATGLIAIRVLFTLDVCVLRAEAFTYSTSIT